MYKFARIEYQLRILQSTIDEEGGEVDILVYLPGMSIRGQLASFDRASADRELQRVEEWPDGAGGINRQIEFVERTVRAEERARRIEAAMLGLAEDAELDRRQLVEQEFFIKNAEVTMLAGEPRRSNWLAVRYASVIAMECSEDQFEGRVPSPALMTPFS